MRYKIFENGEQINTIIADEAFCKSYCDKHGYTYEEEIIEPIPEPEEEPDVYDELAAAYTEGVNSI